MKITYAVPVELDAAKGGNVQHVLGICRNASKSGIQIKLICLKGQNSIPKEDFHIVTMDSQGMGAFERILKFSKFALSEIKNNHKPDWIYLRPFPLDYLLFTRHLKKMNLKFAYELNTLWANELRSQGKELKAHIYPWFEAKSIKEASALFPVTQEISEHASSVGGLNIPTLVAGNGIDIPNLPKESKKEIRRKWNLPVDKKLAVMAGFTRPWHGCDKLIASLALVPNDLHVVLIGAENEQVKINTIKTSEKYGVNNRVHILPWLNHAEVSEIVYACDFGISPLAKEIMKMKEAQSLKVRHYLAMGIPVLIAGGETKEVLDSKFTYQVKDTSAEEIKVGLLHLQNVQYQPEEIRDFARSKLSWDSIAAKTFSFMKEMSF